jgi:hypothetical protein
MRTQIATSTLSAKVKDLNILEKTQNWCYVRTLNLLGRFSK